jgi:hypothetical protein
MLIRGTRFVGNQGALVQTTLNRRQKAPGVRFSAPDNWNGAPFSLPCHVWADLELSDSLLQNNHLLVQVR